MNNLSAAAPLQDLFFQQTPVALCTFTADFLLASFNPAAATLLSIDEGNLGRPAETLARFFNNGIERSADEALKSRERIASGKTIIGKYEIRLPNDKVCFLHATISPLYSAGELSGFAGVFQDITHINNTSVFEKEKTNDLQLLYELSGVTTHAVFILDDKYNIRFWNRGAEILFDVEPLKAKATLQNQPLPVRFTKHEEHLLRKGHDFSKEIEWQNAKHYRFQFKRRENPDTSYIVTCYDITEKKVQEAIIEANNERFDKTLKEKDDAIFLAHQRLQYHLNNTPLGIAEWDNTLIISWSKRAEEIFGWTAGEAVGKTAEELQLISETDPVLLNFRERVYNQRSTAEHSIVCNRHKDGHSIFCEWYSSVLRNENGDVVSLLTFVEDITPRVLAEKDLLFKKNQLSTIFNSTKDILFLVDVEPAQNFSFSAVNRQFLEVTGLSEEAIIGKDAMSVYPSESREYVLQNHRHVLLQKQSITWEQSAAFSTGRKTGVVTLSPVFDETGRCTQLVGSAHDVTERRKLEAEVLKMQAIVHSSPNYISIIRPDEERSYDFINAAGREMLGIKNLSLEGMTVEKALGQQEKERLSAIAVKTGGEFSEQTYLQNQDTGEKIPVLLNCFRIANEGESYFACIASDMREINNARNNLEEANTRLKALTEHLQIVRDGERVAIAREIHDELGQLLTATKIDVHGAVQQLKNNPAAAIRKLDDALILLDTTINTIRRIVSHLRPDLLDDLGLVEALRWHVEQFEHKTGIPAVFDCSSKEIVASPETALSVFRICQEALTNVQRYAKASEVEISLKTLDGSVQLSVKDNGLGFDPETLSRKKSFGIVGMKERVSLCGGNMRLTSATGQGTSIFITIPLTHHEQNN